MLKIKKSILLEVPIGIKVRGVLGIGGLGGKESKNKGGGLKKNLKNIEVKKIFLSINSFSRIFLIEE